jgi:hypothetical protein
MSLLEKKSEEKKHQSKITYDPALDNLPIPKAALEKVERARKMLREHPIPEHTIRR